MKYTSILSLALIISCSPGPTGSQGDTYFENGDYALAVDEYSKTLSNDPENKSALYNRGRSYEELGKFRKAISDFEKIIKNDPKHVSSYLSLSKIAYAQKNYSKALLHAGEAIKQNENSAKAYFLSARAAHQLGYADQAMEAYNNAISIDSEYGEAFLYRGALKVGNNRIRAACSDFRKARALDVEGAASALKDYCR